MRAIRTMQPQKRFKSLAEKQDLVEFFKAYLYSFQYPGAHIKSHAVLEQIEHGIRFKPAQYILKLLKHACAQEGKNIGLTKFEICHCVFNDLRCTRDKIVDALNVIDYDFALTEEQLSNDYKGILTKYNEPYNIYKLQEEICNELDKKFFCY